MKETKKPPHIIKRILIATFLLPFMGLFMWGLVCLGGLVPLFFELVYLPLQFDHLRRQVVADDTLYFIVFKFLAIQQVVTYELRAARSDKPVEYEHDAPLATSRELELFYEHLERVLTDIRFLDPDNPRHLMRRLRRLFIRARPDQNEVNILRGILTAVDRSRESGT